MFLVFVGGPDCGGIEELFNLREGGRGRIVGGRGRGREREGEDSGREREGEEGEGGGGREREMKRG